MTKAISVRVNTQIFMNGIIVPVGLHKSPSQELIALAKEVEAAGGSALAIVRTSPVEEDGENGIDQNTGSEGIDFMSADDFEDLTATKQKEYIEQIVSFEAEDKEAYESALYEALTSYKEFAKATVLPIVEKELEAYDAE